MKSKTLKKIIKIIKTFSKNDIRVGQLISNLQSRFNLNDMFYITDEELLDFLETMLTETKEAEKIIKEVE